MNLRSPNPEENRVPFAGAENFFAGWRQSLAKSGLSDVTEAGYRRGIEAYSVSELAVKGRVSVATQKQALRIG